MGRGIPSLGLARERPAAPPWCAGLPRDPQKGLSRSGSAPRVPARSRERAPSSATSIPAEFPATVAPGSPRGAFPTVLLGALLRASPRPPAPFPLPGRPPSRLLRARRQRRRPPCARPARRPPGSGISGAPTPSAPTASSRPRCSCSRAREARSSTLPRSPGTLPQPRGRPFAVLIVKALSGLQEEAPHGNSWIDCGQKRAHTKPDKVSGGPHGEPSDSETQK